MAGWRPIREAIDLTKGADWIYSRDRDDGPFPTNTVIEIKWASGATWPATIAGSRAAWRVESEVADLIPENTEYTIFVRYPNLTTSTFDDYAWKIGRCRRTQVKS
ncbi:hypothetical protein ABH922_002974 [Rhodococcus sp. 27YEA15]|uniref:LtfC-like domain-containing protein n=1 Tax=Rhodococcus sp. 27YEA15 TaxID=3156259 RepID=UPI003C7AA60E